MAHRIPSCCASTLSAVTRDCTGCRDGTSWKLDDTVEELAAHVRARQARATELAGRRCVAARAATAVAGSCAGCVAPNNAAVGGGRKARQSAEPKPEEHPQEKKQETKCGMRCKDGSYCKTNTAKHRCKRHMCRVDGCRDRCIEDCETTDPPRYVCQRHANEEVAESARLHRAELLAKEKKETSLDRWTCG